MTDLRKAAEMALEALEKQHNWMVANGGGEMFAIPSKKAINELRQALAIEEQISLEYCDKCGWRAIAPPDGCLICDKKKWVELNDEELEDLEFASVDKEYGHLDIRVLSQAIGAKLKKKNT